MRESLLEHLIAPGSRRGDGVGDGLTLHGFSSRGGEVEEGVLSSWDGRWWWIVGGVPRLLPPSLYVNEEMESRWGARVRALGLPLAAKDERRATGRVEARTIDRFGAEWLMFRDWGWFDEPPAGGEAGEYHGGLWSHTLGAFRSKTFLDGRLGGKLVLDGGCGNGRFMRAALECGAREVIGVDIGWGVDAAREHFRDEPRAHVVQGSLFDLPVRRVDSAYSIGVLMHTGDAARAFGEIARAVKPGGEFAVRMYHRGNAAYECVDGAIRAVTTRLGKGAQLTVSKRMAGIGRWLIARDGGETFGPRRRAWYQVLRNWPTVHHNLDWWSAPVATHHTAGEVGGWGRAAGLRVVKSDPTESPQRYGFWEWPEALTMLFERAPEAAEMRVAA